MNYLDKIRNGKIDPVDLDLARDYHTIREIRGALAVGYRRMAEEDRKRGCIGSPAEYEAKASALERGETVRLFGINWYENRTE